MPHGSHLARPAAPQVRRWIAVLFVVGFLIAVPATFVALLSTTGEAAFPYLFPGAAILGALLSDSMRDWNGAVNMLLGSVVNGLVYALVGGLAATALGAVGRK
jgi:hypothetical protein